MARRRGVSELGTIAKGLHSEHYEQGDASERLRPKRCEAS